MFGAAALGAVGRGFKSLCSETIGSLGFFISKINEDYELYALWMEKLLIRLVFGITIGSRLSHVLFYEPHYYFLHSEEIFMIWKGGLASHGGALLASYLFWKNNRIGSLSWEELLDIPSNEKFTFKANLK
ncbi:hypothetical protein ACTFIW_003862 [Dictyostelium discoideum]